MVEAKGAVSGRSGAISRRTAIGGLVAAAMTPSIVSRVWAQSEVSSPTALSPASGTPIPREQHTATTLQDGRVLVVGGLYLGPLSSVQIYDPNANMWFDAAHLSTPRSQHAAVLLQDGNVLVTGGVYLGPLSSAEIFDPNANTWSPAPSLNSPRFRHGSALLIKDGTAIVCGGYFNGPLSSVEVFDGNSWVLR